MRRILVMMCFLMFLVSCSFVKPEPIHPLFSDDENKYSLLVIDEQKELDIGYEWGEKHNIRNFNTVRTSHSLEYTAKSYKFLELEKSPAFVVFDMEGIVFKTYSEDELINFLKEN